MFGDCQILSSMGGNGVPSDSYYPSSIQNPSFSFMTNLPFNIFPPALIPEENGMSRSKEEILESGSGSEHVEGGVSGNEQEAEQQQPTKKKRYHRHTARQIQEMEALFKECPHPDDKQRLKLSQDLGLKPRQVKFWFQNRRTQMKAQQDRADNAILRAENESLKNENYRLQAALRNVVCPNCGGPAVLGEMGFDEQTVRLENARLKEELMQYDRVCALLSQYGGRAIPEIGTSSLLAPSLDLDINMLPRKFEEPIGDCPGMLSMPFIPENPNFSGGVLILDEEKSIAMELAISSVEELMKMCQACEPLWLRTSDGSKEVLNVDEYRRLFQWGVDLKQNPSQVRTEATRHNAVVIMNSITLVDAFLDANKWMELFPSIVSRAKTLQVVTSGISGQASGSLQLMYAELQVPSPLVPTRESHFLRYCHQNAEEGTWAIVDFPLDNFNNNYPTIPYYKRRPSGCIIQDMPNGYSRVTWVEHVEIDSTPLNQTINHLVSSGNVFGAKRWLSVLQRQCERIASLMARNISDLGVIPSPEARKNVMYLSQRMIRTFCMNISNACGQSWTALSDSAEDTVRIATRKVSGPGEPNGLILTAVSTTWLPYPHYQVFDLLRDERRRSQLDVLSNGNALQEVAHIANGSHPGNCVSLLRINVASNSSQKVELMLQESCTDDSGSLIVYTTVDVDSIQLAMNGEDPECIPLLPVGFVIHPLENGSSSHDGSSLDNDQTSENGNNLPADLSGCLLTVGLQVLASTIPTAKLNLSSVTAINQHICNTVQQISAALGNHGSNIGTTSSNDNDNIIIASLGEPSAPAPPPVQPDQVSTP
ncbi:homeobox-leucine zipper protein HDG5 isoform X2 [Coffea eugenioides]|uniref:homeobox-leucine zipper protein HDG5 isoform X2 n=1 Tax=Coffea eugenioides TaxID=49369 RepID=UPI000F607484|nr:homeobox-leucine zipper protein HDG5 isoform X2 [Coffea eugenioides]